MQSPMAQTDFGFKPAPVQSTLEARTDNRNKHKAELVASPFEEVFFQNGGYFKIHEACVYSMWAACRQRKQIVIQNPKSSDHLYGLYEEQHSISDHGTF